MNFIFYFVFFKRNFVRNFHNHEFTRENKIQQKKGKRRNSTSLYRKPLVSIFLGRRCGGHSVGSGREEGYEGRGGEGRGEGGKKVHEVGEDGGVAGRVERRPGQEDGGVGGQAPQGVGPNLHLLHVERQVHRVVCPNFGQTCLNLVIYKI